ncbi:MAG TPA: DUF3892 domain-containing protein [bacterium]|nr:DUF3892 domain-containing protein [bacterium]
MVKSYKVWFVKRREADDVYQQITHIGGLTEDYYRWIISLDEAINGIETGRWIFYIQHNGSPERLVIGHSPDGIKYLKTEMEISSPESLLSLPDIS